LVAKGVLSSRFSLDPVTAVAVALSAVQYATGDDGTWIDRALLGLDTLQRERDLRAWADAGVTRRVRRGWVVDVGARLGRMTGIELLEPTGTPRPPASGGVGEVRVGLSLPVTAGFPLGRIAYRYTTPLGGDAALRVALESAPSHVIEGSVAALIAGDVRLGTHLYGTSAARWPALRGAGPAQTTLPWISRLDLSAEKWFWRHRVRTQLLLRNVLDRPERHHPLGADLPLRAHITVGLALPGSG
jgi:hypothetical protein